MALISKVMFVWGEGERKLYYPAARSCNGENVE